MLLRVDCLGNVFGEIIHKVWVDNMAAGRDELSSGLKVFELKEKLAEFGLSTQGDKETLRERLV